MFPRGEAIGAKTWERGRGRRLPAFGDVAALVRLPAVLSVPGDALLGAAVCGRRVGARAVGLTGSSALLYLGGMALNDWADQEADARERPARPIPSGRVAPGFALGLATALTAGGVAVAAAVGGREALAVALPLAGAVWAYDLVLKDTPAGPAAMASCRALDVLLGAVAGGPGVSPENGRGPGVPPVWRRLGPAVPAAAVVGAHTAVVSTVSRREAEGAGPELPRRALAATAGVTAGALALARSRLRRGGRGQAVRLGMATGLLGAYAGALASAELAAAREPTPARLQRVVGTGVLALMPLEAALLSAAGPAPAAAGVAAAWPLARRLARRRAVT